MKVPPRVREVGSGMIPTALLPGPGMMVWVGPPLPASGLRASAELDPALTSPVPPLKQLVSVPALYPPSVHVPPVRVQEPSNTSPATCTVPPPPNGAPLSISPPLPAVLPVKVEAVTCTVPGSSIAPPELLAVLWVKVEAATVTDPLIAPPRTALLPEKVEAATVTDPPPPWAPVSIAPPVELAVLPLKVEAVTCIVPP